MLEDFESSALSGRTIFPLFLAEGASRRLQGVEMASLYLACDPLQAAKPAKELYDG